MKPKKNRLPRKKKKALKKAHARAWAIITDTLAAVSRQYISMRELSILPTPNFKEGGVMHKEAADYALGAERLISVSKQTTDRMNDLMRKHG